MISGAVCVFGVIVGIFNLIEMAVFRNDPYAHHIFLIRGLIFLVPFFILLIMWAVGICARNVQLKKAYAIGLLICMLALLTYYAFYITFYNWIAFGIVEAIFLAATVLFAIGNFKLV